MLSPSLLGHFIYLIVLFRIFYFFGIFIFYFFFYFGNFIFFYLIFLQYQLHYSARDELCRDLFHRLFAYTVGLINRSLHNGLQDKDIASLPHISIYRVPPKVSDTPTLTLEIKHTRVHVYGTLSLTLIHRSRSLTLI